MFDFVNVIVSFLTVNVVDYMAGAVMLFGAFQLTFKMIKG